MTGAKPDRPAQRKFLAAYSVLGTVRAACEHVGVGRRTHYDWMRDPKYAAAFERAKEMCCEQWEEEAIRRATQGVEKPLMYKGRECGRVREYSDNLLMFLIKAAKPEKYRDNAKVEHTGPGGEPLTVNVRFVSPEKAA